MCIPFLDPFSAFVHHNRELARWISNKFPSFVDFPLSSSKRSLSPRVVFNNIVIAWPPCSYLCLFGTLPVSNCIIYIICIYIIMICVVHTGIQFSWRFKCSFCIGNLPSLTSCRIPVASRTTTTVICLNVEVSLKVKINPFKYSLSCCSAYVMVTLNVLSNKLAFPGGLWWQGSS